MQLNVRDETTSGDVLGALELQLTEERTTVRDLIRARVHQEVRSHNAERAGREFKGLVRPRAATNRVDAEAQTEVACKAFERGQVLLLVDDRQRTELEEEVVLTPDSSAVFLKLVPLVGG